MARKIIELVEVTDDVTGDIISEEDSDIVRFALDGVALKLETSKDQADGFREMLARFVALAQVDDEFQVAPKLELARTTATARRSTPARAAAPARRPSGSGHTKSGVRAWGVGEGRWPELGDRGRIPGEIMEAYAKTHGISVNDID